MKSRWNRDGRHINERYVRPEEVKEIDNLTRAIRDVVRSTADWGGPQRNALILYLKTKIDLTKKIIDIENTGRKCNHLRMMAGLTPDPSLLDGRGGEPKNEDVSRAIRSK